jgi:primosomal protein N' (replication factor Y)
MTQFVEIAVNIPHLSGVFHYHAPPDLEGRIVAGHLVEVPFGKQRAQGVVLRPVEQPEVAETRPILSLLDPDPVITPAQIALAQQLAETTLSSLAAIIGLMLPAGMGQVVDSLYTLQDQNDPASETGKLAARLLKLLAERGPLRGRQIDDALPRFEWRPAMQALVRAGTVAAQSHLPPPRVHPKRIRTVQLTAPPEQAEAALPALGQKQALARRQAVVRCLLRDPGPVNVSWVYAETGAKLDDLRYLAERGLAALGESEIWRDPLERVDAAPSENLTLSGDQHTAWEQIHAQIMAASRGESAIPCLLHGVTGSGKTELYLRAVEETLRLGRQAIVLVPEIALTPQTVRRFVSRFAGRVGLAHSQLSEGERYDTWRRARQGLISLVIGPRSALFIPFANLGLIVLDECHDDSFYQAEAPYYHTRRAAVLYARLAGAACLMGSATPDLVTRYQAERGALCYLPLPARVQGEIPPVQVVDMRHELKAGNTSIFSRALQTELSATLARGEQAILFLNRRGTATFVFCRACGHTLQCPHCELPLTLHQAVNLLTCHHCNYHRRPPGRCPQCESDKIRAYGTGTERVEAEVQKLFPAARTLRWDAETTRAKGAHEIILHHFANHQADVLVGTQMIAKGLDLPLVTLVGIVLADVGLSLPDYRASERTFQVLTQVAGRAGRSARGGSVILQTFQPDSTVIQSAARHDYAAFYRTELEHRRALGYPPFSRLVRLEIRSTDPARGEAAAQKLAASLEAWIGAEDRRATEMIGPAPCFFARVAGQYRWQVVLRGPDPLSILRGKPLNDWRVEVDPVSLL